MVNLTRFPANDFFGIEQLENILMLLGIDSSKWRSGKTPSDLLIELRKGESELVLARRVCAVRLRVVRDVGAGKYQRLLETGKRFADGQEVMYEDPRDPAGKISAGEDPEIAFIRELDEELHLSAEDYFGEFVRFDCEPKVEDSRSFPGILGIYQFYGFQIKVRYKCFERFWKESELRYEIPDRGNPGRILYFTWSQVM